MRTSDILAAENTRLYIMYSGIQVDKHLLKYSSIKKEIEEFKKSKAPATEALNSLSIEMDTPEILARDSFEERENLRKLINDYEIIKNGDIHSINIYINKGLFEEILSEFNEFPSNSLSSIQLTTKGDAGYKKTTFFSKLSELFSFKNTEEVKNIYSIDILEFFSQIKGLAKSEVNTYIDRLEGYIAALKHCDISGQTALKEKLLRDMVINKYESVLYAKGLYYAVTENQVVDFVKKTEKGVELTYIKNYIRIIPQQVVFKIEEINKLEIFDNYVILHYDPECKSYSETIKETAKRRDPILFGVIKGSNKLYYITDWVDEYCDLTLDKFVETIQVKMKDIKLKDNII